MALLHSKRLYHGNTSLYFTLHYSTMALLDSTWLYMTLTWFYFTLLVSNYSTMDLLHSTWLHITLQCLYFIVLDSSLLYHSYFTLLDSTLHYPCSNKFIKHDSTMSFLHSTLFYIFLQWLYFTLYFILHDSTMHLLHSTFLYHGSISLFAT